MCKCISCKLNEVVTDTTGVESYKCMKTLFPFFFCGSMYVQVIVPGVSISTVFDCLQYAVSNQKAGVCKQSKNWGCKNI